jgi:hypothetical protein
VLLARCSADAVHSLRVPWDGFNTLVYVFERGMKTLLPVHAENRVLISLFVTVLGLLFYALLFRRTMRAIYSRHRARHVAHLRLPDAAAHSNSRRNRPRQGPLCRLLVDAHAAMVFTLPKML